MVKTVIQGDVIYTRAHSNSNTLNQLFLEIGALKLESLVLIVTRTNFREEFLPYRYAIVEGAYASMAFMVTLG